MKRFKFSFLLLFTVLVVGINSYAKDKNTTKTEKVYMFGFSASFNDSLVYITDIQGVDSVEIEPKTDFLVGRTAYGNQLQFYLADYKERPNMVGMYETALPKEVPEKMRELLAWYHGISVKTLSVMAQFHARYEALHPFQDGRDEFSFKREINKVISE